jgi:hypothetical protein
MEEAISYRLREGADLRLAGTVIPKYLNAGSKRHLKRSGEGKMTEYQTELHLCSDDQLVWNEH